MNKNAILMGGLVGAIAGGGVLAFSAAPALNAVTPYLALATLGGALLIASSPFAKRR